MHKNYLIFVEFICKNLNDDQRTKTKQWVDELYTILNERPAAKTYENCNNTDTLVRNNKMSADLLKTLCRGVSDQADYNKMVVEILK